MKSSNFKKVFQINKIVEFEIHLKMQEIENFQVVKLFIDQDKNFYRFKKQSWVGKHVKMSCWFGLKSEMN